jgi:hypothetical protein
MTRGQALAAVVLIHFGINIAHGRAHAGAHVPLPFAAAIFVYGVILAGPLVGLGVSRWWPQLGGWLVATCMSGALVFGVINHFIIDGPDHVGHVAVEWQLWFGATAALLVVCEAAGAIIGLWCALSNRRRSLVSE